MKHLVLATVIVLLVASTASAGWTYVGPAAVPAPAVYSYWPVGPVYTYPSAVYVAPAPMTYARPVVVPAPTVVRTKVFVRGRPVRRAIRFGRPW